MDHDHDTGAGIPFFGYMTTKGPVIISHPELSKMEAFSVVKGVYTPTNGSTDDGGDNMESRITALETDVANIKISISDIKEDTRKISSDATDAKRDTAVLLQKTLDFDASLSKKPSVDYFETKFLGLETKISEVKTWVLGVLLASFAMPTIFFLINLYLRKS